MAVLHKVLIVMACALVVSAMFVHPSAAQDNGAQSSVIEMGTPFVDGAVLQRDMKVPVWGWAEPSAEVTVAFAGQSKAGKAGADGKWVVELDALQTSADPGEMTVTLGSGESITIKDILVGEVWIASGQSNMQWLASKCDVGRVLQAGIAQRVEAGQEKAPIIREAKVTDVFSALHPIEHAQGEWIDDAGQMSAVAYAFAYDLWKELGVPIGIVNCSFSSTSIESWVPREGFTNSRHAYTQSIHQKLLESDPSTPEHKRVWETFYRGINDAIQANEERVKNNLPAKAIKINAPGNVSGNRDATWLYNARMHPMVPYAVRGAIWNQGYANMNGGITYYDNLHSLARGWRENWQREDLPIYFNQFYTPGKADGPDHPSFSSTAEMRLGTWMARDIPNTGMASQIDIGGSVHYYRKALAGQRLALHALKHQYGKDVVTDGPMFKSYAVKGNQLIVSFDHAKSGLVVGQVQPDSKLPGVPVLIPMAEAELDLFYLADEDQVWHQATAEIKGDKVVLTAPGVAKPRGVSYATAGVGPQPNLYNQSLLPMTPFAYYDKKMVTKATWPHDPPNIAGYEPDPNAGGLSYEYRKLPLLSTQFRDRAVLQHGKPVTIWGSAIHNWGEKHHAELVGDRKVEIRLSFGEVEKTIAVTPGMQEWSVTLDPMEPTAEGRALSVQYYIGGELIHERVAEDVVVGDVWFVAAPAMKVDLPQIAQAEGIVRVMQRKAKRDTHDRPSRFSIAVSTTPKNRFASEWLDADTSGQAGAIAQHLAAKTKHPVGVIFMQNVASKDQVNPPLKSWLPFEALADAPDFADDYRILGATYPGAPSYNANLKRYIKDWQVYWSDYVPAMIETKRVPDGSAWGVLPSQATKGETSEATGSYNVMVHSFTPSALKGVLFFRTPEAFESEQAEAHFKLLMKSWNERFGSTPNWASLRSDLKADVLAEAIRQVTE